MKVYLKIFGGNVHDVDIEPSTTVDEVKAIFQEKELIDPKNMRIVFKCNEILDGSTTLEAMGVPEFGEIVMFFQTVEQLSIDESFFLDREKLIKRPKKELFRSRSYIHNYLKALHSGREKNLKESLDFFELCFENANTKQLQANGWYYKGRVYEQAGELEEALKCYEACMKVEPGHFYGLYRIGKCFQKMGGKGKHSKLFFLKCIKVCSTKFCKPYYELSRWYRDVEEDEKKSKKFLAKCLEISPTFVMALCDQLLWDSIENQDYDHGIINVENIIEENLKQEKYFSYPYLVKSLIYQEYGEFDDALAAIDKAIEMQNFVYCTEQSLYSRRAHFLFQLQSWDEAIKSFVLAIEKSGDDADHFTFNALGVAYQEIEEFEKAVESFQKAVTMCQQVAYYENIANCFIKLDRGVEAAQTLAKGVALNVAEFQSFENIEYANEVLKESQRNTNFMMLMLKECELKSPVPIRFLMDPDAFMDPLNLEGRDDFGQNPLHFACMNRKVNLDVVKFLLSEIDPKDPSHKGETCLFCLARCGEVNIDVLKFLVEEKELELGDKNVKNRTLLHEMCKKEIFNEEKCIEAIKYFSENGIDVNDLDAGKRNALHLLCRTYNDQKKKVGKFLVEEMGVKIDQEDSEGKTPFEYLPIEYCDVFIKKVSKE